MTKTWCLCSWHCDNSLHSSAQADWTWLKWDISWRHQLRTLYCGFKEKEKISDPINLTSAPNCLCVLHQLQTISGKAECEIMGSSVRSETVLGVNEVSKTSGLHLDWCHWSTVSAHWVPLVVMSPFHLKALDMMVKFVNELMHLERHHIHLSTDVPAPVTQSLVKLIYVITQWVITKFCHECYTSLFFSIGKQFFYFSFE